MKQKRKRQVQQWPWSVRRFDYIVDAPMENTLAALNQYKEDNSGCFISFNPTRVNIDPTKTGQEYGLRINKRTGNNLDIVLKAQVESLDANYTRIHGIARTELATLIIMGILFCTHVLGVGFIGGILGKSSFMLLFGCFSVLIFISFFAALTSGINKMIQELEEVIHKAEYGNDQQWIQKKKHPSYNSMDDFQIKKRGKSHAV